MQLKRIEKAQPTGLHFEEEVKEFLQDLKFQDVDGGKSFVINGVQVDAVGGYDKTLLVIECTTKRKLRNKIETLRGNIVILQEGFKKHPIYKKYANCRFIVATNTKRVRTEDKNFSKEKPRMFLWDGNFFEYYDKLYRLIGEYAKYNIFCELKVKPSKKSMVEVMALKAVIRGYSVYQFFANPKRLLEVSYVARRERGREQYYQRLIKGKRLKAIVRFLDEKRGIFPTNLIVSIRQLTFNSIKRAEDIEIGVLKFPKQYGSCWVIDGQHRLYSFSHSESQILIPVLAFEKLDLTKHAKFFLEINKEQKPVPPDLLWDLEGLLRPNEEEGIISRICKKLNQGDGPLKDRIYIPLYGPSKEKMLKLSGLCKSIQKAKLVREYSYSRRPAKGVNPLFGTDPNKLLQKVSTSLNAYFLFIDKTFDESTKRNFVFTNGGISVMVYLFEHILSILPKKPRDKDFEKYVTPVMEYLNEYRDLRELRDRCNSEGGRDRVVVDFVRAIYRKTGDKEILGGIEPADIDKLIIKEFEPSVRTFVKKVLLKRFPTDWGKKIPSDIVDKIKAKHEIQPPNEKFFEELDLGQCEKIMRSSANEEIFRKLLLHPKFGFTDEEQLWVIYHTLKRFRDTTAHGKEVEFKYKDEDLIKLALDKFKICFEESSRIL